MTSVIIISITLLLSIIIPLTSGNLTSTTTATTAPLIPSIQTPSTGGKLTSSCQLDLSSELFGGVSSACSSSTPLDRGRCCPVLAAWLFAAHSRSSLSSPSDDKEADDGGLLPLMPDEDSQRCVESLHSSLRAKKIELPRVNDTCDTVLCFCGIRLHQIGRLSCPNAFNVSHVSGSNSSTVKPMKVVEDLERDCRNSSYNGCTRCLRSLEKLKGSSSSSSKGSKNTTDRSSRMFRRDCQLMGLTWLLAKNKTLYIPTVSAVLRALLYSDHQQPYYYTCSRDQDNMPLAVDSLQFYKLDSSSSSSFSFALYPLLMVGVFLSWL